MDKHARMIPSPYTPGRLLNRWTRHLCLAVLAIATSFVFSGDSFVAAQTSKVSTPAPSTQVSLDSSDRIVANGQQLESEGQWGEALNLYQQALKKRPGDQLLRKRRTVARIHYDLERRYADSSFLRTINDTNGTKALNVYAEVLLKIQSYYVDEPQWALLTHYGLASVDVALGSPEFREINLPNVSEAQIDAAIVATQKVLSNYKVGSRHDAYMVASSAAQQLNKHLGLSVQATVYEFVCGAISALDPYSAFMSSNQYNETMSQIEGNFVGLGVELKTQSDHLEIVSVIPGGSAGLGGVKKGDKIVGVDGKKVIQLGGERAADMLRGVEGSYVVLEIKRSQPKLTSLRLQRRRVEIPSVDKVKIVDAKKGVGYIHLTNFQKTTVRDFDAALWNLHRQGMRSLIVDVRGNPGGLLTSSVEIADRFVSSGIIVSTHGRNPMEDFTHRAQASNTWRVPLVVLIDENSASASEIFAAAIRDHKRGTIVGHQSYGKGSVQGIFPLNVSGGGVRLTTAKFYSPKGTAISQVGVKADVTVQEVAKTDGSNETADDAALRIGIQAADREAQLRNARLQQQQTRSFADR